MATDDTVDLGIAGLEDAVLVGRGGFATVYRAYQPAFRRTVAVKVVSTTQVDERTGERFQRECQALGLLSEHPSIVTVHDAGFLSDGRPYLVMAYMPEGSLQDRLHREGRLGWEEVTRIGVKMAGALDTAHHAGILHRDVKPLNVLMSQYGEPQLADFGIARVAGGPETSSGVITASLSYAPVEIVEGHKPTVRSDVYSLGATLHALLSGKAPHWRTGEESVAALLRRVMSDPAPDLRPMGIPEQLCAVVERAMAKDPSQRYASAADLGRALREVQEELGIPPTKLSIYTPAAKEAPKPKEADEPTHRGPIDATDTAKPAQPEPTRAAAVEPTLTTTAKPDRRWWYAGGAAALVAVAVIIGAIAFSGDDDPQAATTTTTAAPTTASAATTTSSASVEISGVAHPACLPGEKAALFEDFQDGEMQGFSLVGATGRTDPSRPQIVPDPHDANNMVLGFEFGAGDLGIAEFGGEHGDAVIRFRVRVEPPEQGTFEVSALGMILDTKPFGPYFKDGVEHPAINYSVRVSWGGGYLLRAEDSGGIPIPADQFVYFVGERGLSDEWASVEWSSFEGLHQVWIDGEMAAELDDPEPVATGGLGYFGPQADPRATPDVRLYVDDFAICELDRPFETAFGE